MRAWAASTVYLLGILLNRPTSAINALGVGLLFELALDPLVITNIGFQLSFICTAAILLVYPSMHRLFLRLLPQRPLQELKSSPFWTSMPTSSARSCARAWRSMPRSTFSRFLSCFASLENFRCSVSSTTSFSHFWPPFPSVYFLQRCRFPFFSRSATPSRKRFLLLRLIRR